MLLGLFLILENSEDPKAPGFCHVVLLLLTAIVHVPLYEASRKLTQQIHAYIPFLYGPALLYSLMFLISLLYFPSVLHAAVPSELYFTVCLQEQKLNKLVIDTGNAKEFERPFRFNPKSNELVEQNPFKSQSGDSKPSQSDRAPNPFNSSSSSEEMQKP